MATTQTVVACNQLKGPHIGADLHAYEVCVLVDGTYLTASKPNFDMLAALQAQHEGVSDVNVKKAALFQDGYDGTNKYTAPNTQIALSGTHNKVITFRVDSGATDGDATGAEIADATALHHYFTFVVITAVTGA